MRKNIIFLYTFCRAIKLLQTSKSSYLGPFLTLAKQIKDVFAEAESNLKFLNCLQGRAYLLRQKQQENLNDNKDNKNIDDEDDDKIITITTRATDCSNNKNNNNNNNNNNNSNNNTATISLPTA